MSNNFNGYGGQKKAESSTKRRGDSGFYETPMEVDGVDGNGSSPRLNGLNGMGFNHLNGVTNGHADGGERGMVITASIGVRSPACRRRNRPNSGGTAAITQVVRNGDEPDTESTTLLRAASAEGARVRPNFSNQPPSGRSSQNNDILGEVTIGAVTQEDTKPEKPDIKPEKPDIKPEKPDIKPQKPDIKPQKPDIKPQKPDIKPEERFGGCGRPWQPIKPDPPKPRVITVYVRDCDKGNKSYSFEVKQTDRVETLQAMVYERLRYAESQQRMTFAGRNLDKGHTLEEYNIMNNSTIDLLLRLRGG